MQQQILQLKNRLANWKLRVTFSFKSLTTSQCTEPPQEHLTQLLASLPLARFGSNHVEPAPEPAGGFPRPLAASWSHWRSRSVHQIPHREQRRSGANSARTDSPNHVRRRHVASYAAACLQLQSQLCCTTLLFILLLFCCLHFHFYSFQYFLFLNQITYTYYH